MAMRMSHGAVLVALAVLIGASAAGCGTEADRPWGAVLLTVHAPTDARVVSADYAINGNATLHGTVTAPPQGDLIELIPRVPAGDAYLATLTGRSADGRHTCTGTKAFRVAKGVTTRLDVDLTCGSVDGGSADGAGRVVIGISVSCHQVPLARFVVSPLVVAVGTYVVARADGARPDGAPLTFEWTAASGTFDSPRASQTTFTCTQAGDVEVKLQVEDDERCQQSYSARVTCLDLGDGGRSD